MRREEVLAGAVFEQSREDDSNVKDKGCLKEEHGGQSPCGQRQGGYWIWYWEHRGVFCLHV